MSSTIPSAEVFVLNKVNEFSENRPPTPDEVEQWMIEFAILHVKQALKEANETLFVKAYCNICNSGAEIDFLENSILHSYPLSNIE
jgi:hypothetical protein